MPVTRANGSGSDAVAAPLVDFVAEIAASESIEELQSTYLDRIRGFLPAPAIGLYLLNPYSGNVASVATRGVSDHFLARYEEHGRANDPVLQRAVAERRPCHNRALMSAEEWRALPVYDEVFSLHRMTNLLEAPIYAGDDLIGTLNFGARDEDGSFRARDLAMAEVVARLVGVALESVRRRTELERDRDDVVAALELCDQAVIVTDRRTGRRRLNHAARALLARILDPDDGTLLEDLVAQQRPAGDTLSAETGVLLDGAGPVRLRLWSVKPEDRPGLMVSFLHVVDEQRRGLPEALDQLLTQRERDVAEFVALGLQDAEIAARLLVSPHTVKEYVKSVYRKLGVHSRVGLTRAVLGVPPDLSPRSGGDVTPPA